MEVKQRNAIIPPTQNPIKRDHNFHLISIQDFTKMEQKKKLLVSFGYNGIFFLKEKGGKISYIQACPFI